MPALCVGSVLLVLIGGFGFTRAEPACGDIQRQHRCQASG